MLVDNKKAEVKSKKRRPLGVWVLIIYTLLYIGFYEDLPIGMLSLGYTAMYTESAMRVNYVYVFLEIFIVITSILAWSGLEAGRRSFLFFILLHFLGDGIYNFQWGTQIPSLGNLDNWIWYMTDFLFPIVCVWYFNKPSVKEFFRKGLNRDNSPVKPLLEN